MKVYKWCIKKDSKYYSLINYDIYHYRIKKKYPPYEIGKIYDNPDKSQEGYYSKGTNISGFHFWKEPLNERFFSQYNRCLINCKQLKINAILECEINEKDIISQNGNHIVSKKFKILNEIILKGV